MNKMSWDSGEKRRFVRAHFPCSITIFTPQEHVLASRTENIGAGGVRVIIEERLEIGVIVGLKISLESNPVTCKGRVVWVVEGSGPSVSSPSFDTGIEFSQIQERDEEFINHLVISMISDE